MRPRLAQAGRFFLWAALLAPAGVLLHELGHFTVARLLGFDKAEIGATAVSGGAVLGTAPDWMVALQAGAGPLVTVALVGLALLALGRGRPAWAIALAATAALRFLIDVVYLGGRLLVWLRGDPPGTPNFDEYNAARALGVSVELVALAASLVLAAAWIRVWQRLGRGNRVMLVPLAAGTAFGLFLWVAFLGPPIAALINRV